MEDQDKIMAILGKAVGFECELVRMIGGLWQIQPMERDPYNGANVFFRWTLIAHREDQYHRTVIGAAYNFMEMLGEWVRLGRPDVLKKSE